MCPPRCRLYARDSQRRTTSIQSPTKHPRWSETFELPVHVPENQELVCGWQLQLGRGGAGGGDG